MDPNAALLEIRAKLEAADGEPLLAAANVLRERALELFRALDDFLSRGGFPPADWTASSPRPSDVPIAPQSIW